MSAAESSAGDTRRARSASAIVGGTVSVQHLLYIDSYSRTKAELPTCRSIESRPFSVDGGGTWYIRFYPNGFSPEFSEYISVVLRLDGAVVVEPFKAQVKFSVLDAAGEPVQASTKAIEVALSGGGRYAYAVGQFINRHLFEKSEYLLDDCFTISCDIAVSQKLRVEERIVPGPVVAVPPSDITQHLGDLLTTEDGADVTFKVAGETFRAHRFLLAVRSPVFKAQLLGGMKESTATGDCIQINDMLPQVFKALLHFVYTDSLLELEMEGEEGVVMAQHLLEAADRYDLQRLKLICAEKLCKHLDASTAATTLVLAEQHNCQGLKDACIEFLSNPDSLEAVMETDGFDQLTKSCPSLIKELLLSKRTTLSKRRKLTNDTGK